MFPTLGLFQKLPCPEKPKCKRPNCLFSHRDDVTEVPTVRVPVDVPKLPQATTRAHLSTPPPVASSSKTQIPIPGKSTSIPAKRSINSPLRAAGSSNGTAVSHGVEPPAKLQRVGTAQRPTAIPTATQTTTGVPLLRVNAAQSRVPLPVRQAMLKNLFDHFKVLYQDISEKNPHLVSEHALRQEEEVYNKSYKLTYRNAVISSIASIKRRTIPDSASHPSVGTEGDIATREEERRKLQALRLSVSHLEPYILTLDEMKQWGYIVEVPPGEGGDQPSAEGSIRKCERCNQPFMVKRREEADECVFHWGKPFSSKTNGEKRRVFTCCSRTTDEDPCSRGPHVFYEKDPEDLHRRHAFSYTRQAPSATDGETSSVHIDTALDVVALDCEMIYSTGGMRVARVSVVDSTGKEIFDEFVRMDEGVYIIDLNTRFSGITDENYTMALLPLSSIRKSLDSFINSDTIVIGHALENDLKTLRMVHHRCVDTAVMFPHRAGPPYRHALRNLVKEHLGKTIQAGGGTVGHSSVEDSIATLDLVRWHVLNGPKPKPKLPAVPEKLDE